jgi:hypothetical protein
MVNLTTKQVETLFEVLEDIGSKLKALGIVEVGSETTYIAWPKTETGGLERVLQKGSSDKQATGIRP